MKKNRNIFIFLIVLFSCKTVICQQIDTNCIIKNLKIVLFSDINLGLLSKSAINDYNNRDLIVTILNSRGFGNCIFFKIGNQVLATDTIKVSNKIIIYSTPPCLKNGDECYFVYGYNKDNSKFYRLKGTIYNDILELYFDLQSWQYWCPISKINKKTIKRFINDFWIENIDLECLIYSLHKNKGKCLDYYSPKFQVW